MEATKMESRLDPIHILVVDDEKDIRDGSERILARMGCQVLTATQGDEALKILKKETASIVLLDMKMPGMDGMEVLKRIRKMDETILVIVITGYATVETAIEAMKQGAYDFIPKPFEPDQLRIVVNCGSPRKPRNWRRNRKGPCLTLTRKRAVPVPLLSPFPTVWW
jgi:two-component system phosphate regulon sensor histidine kinase PhoR